MCRKIDRITVRYMAMMDGCGDTITSIIMNGKDTVCNTTSQ